jgi:beta-glucanase (GH16 family)
LVYEDDFNSINNDVWRFEIQRGGFGYINLLPHWHFQRDTYNGNNRTGSFDWTTNDPSNVFTDEQGLHIVPTLTTETTNITAGEIMDGYVLNLTTAGTCTSTSVTSCSIRSNITSGDIVNPVRSARITTQGKKSITYGRVEVVAKMPKGDWLWPAIW